jgi:hypothetical protein
LELAPSVWLKAFEGPTEAMDPAAARGSAAMKERRRNGGLLVRVNGG